MEILDIEKHERLSFRCLGASCPIPCCKSFQYIYVPLYEAVHLAKFFPVVFMLKQTGNTTAGSLVAMTKLSKGDSCAFLGEKGCSLGNERPSFCKAYPFSVVPSQEGKNIVLIDTNCPGFSQDEGEFLFKEKGILNPYFDREFLRFAFLIKEDVDKTQEFIKELINNKLLTGGRFIYKIGNEQKEIHFNYVDERRLVDMPAEKLKSFADRGYMRIIYAHLNSLQNFQRIVDRSTHKD